MSNEAITWAFNQNISSPTQKFVLVALADITDDHEICFPSISYIIKKTAFARRTVHNAISDLIENGFIDKADRAGANGKNISNVYRLKMSNRDISDHPLSVFFKGAGDALGMVQEMVQEMQGDGAGDAGHNTKIYPLLNPNINIRLTRDEFLREIDKAYRGEYFTEYKHLTETEIMQSAVECYEFLITELKEPKEGTAPLFVSRFIRTGIRMKKIRKAPQGVKVESDAPEQSKPAQVEEVISENPNPVADWQWKLRESMEDHTWRAWIKPLWTDTQGNVCAHTSFLKNWVKDNYRDEIARVMPDAELILKPYQPITDKEIENV